MGAAMSVGAAAPRREGGDRPQRGGDDDGPAPEFAPAFLTGDRD
jgi:polyribonucleotide nucleotidyltransferase